MSQVVPEDQRVSPPVGDLSDVKDPPTRVYVRAHANVFGLAIGGSGWIANDEEAVEAVRLGFVSFVEEPREPRMYDQAADE